MDNKTQSHPAVRLRKAIDAILSLRDMSQIMALITALKTLLMWIDGCRNAMLLAGITNTLYSVVVAVIARRALREVRGR